MEPPENSVEARELSMQVQLAGRSSTVTREEAEAGFATARADLEAGRGSGYGLGFGFVKNIGSPRGLDGVQSEVAVTDGDRVANIHAIVSGSRLSMLGRPRFDEVDEEVLDWIRGRLYEKAGAISRSSDRYAALLTEAHPLHL
jgi:hypothetical protein